MMELDGSSGPTMFDCSNQIKIFKCKTCPNFRTHFLTSLRRHIGSGHRGENFETKIYKCLGCFFGTSSRYLHLRHTLFSECATPDDEEKKERFVCCRDPDNGTTFTPKIEQKTSRETSSVKPGPSASTSSKSNGSNDVESSDSPSDMWECEQCQYKTKYEGILLSHMALRHSKSGDIRWLSCDYCRSKFMQRENLENHITLCHTSFNHFHYTKLGDNEGFQCEQCPLKCRFKSSLKRHVINQHSKPEDIQWLNCDQCDSKFKRKSGLKAHIVSCHSKLEDIRWFECYRCNSKFKQKGALKLHMKNLHSKPEDVHWFKCDQCSYKNKQKWNLQRHKINRH